MSIRAFETRARVIVRRCARRLHDRARWLVAAAVLGLVVFAAWVVLLSSWLGVRSVEVDGATTTSAAEVSRAARVPAGTPLARVDLAAVRERVQAIPTVASAVVRRSWPSTVVIEVTERRPVADIARDGSWWLVDDTGRVYLKVAQRDAKLPVVVLAGSPQPGTLLQVATALKALPSSLLARMQGVRAASMDSITLSLDGDREVMWGSAALSGQKAEVLAALLATKARHIDVSVPSHPAVR